MTEQEAKDKNTQEYVDQYVRARNKLEQNYGVEMDESEWEIFWRAFSDSNVVSKFGSDTIVFIGEEVRNDPDLTMRQAARIAAKTIDELGPFKDQDFVRLDFNDMVDAYKELRYAKDGPKLSDDEAMDQIVDIVKAKKAKREEEEQILNND